MSVSLRSLRPLSRLVRCIARNNNTRGGANPVYIASSSSSLFSSKSGVKKPLDDEEHIEHSATPTGILAKLGPSARTALTVGSGSVVLYGISRMFYDVAYSFMGLTPAVSLKYGFAFGLISAGSAAGMGYFLERAIYAKPEIAFGLAMRMINKDEAVRSLVGGTSEYSSSDIKTYKSRGGSFGVVNGSLTWKAPRVEMMLSARGQNTTSTPSTNHSTSIDGNSDISITRGTHLNILVVVEQRLFSHPLVEFCGADIMSDSSRTQKKRTRLVITELDPAMEQDHFAIMDRMGASLEAMRRARL